MEFYKISHDQGFLAVLSLIIVCFILALGYDKDNKKIKPGAIFALIILILLSFLYFQNLYVDDMIEQDRIMRNMSPGEKQDYQKFIHESSD